MSERYGTGTRNLLNNWKSADGSSNKRHHSSSSSSARNAVLRAELGMHPNKPNKSAEEVESVF